MSEQKKLVVKLLWVSGRRMGDDLASSTEKFLSENLASMGSEVTLISPGKCKSSQIKHIEIIDIKFPGITSISGSMKLKGILSNLELEEYNIMMIDWRYIKPLGGLLRSIRVPWAIIDRGPPVGQGVLSYMQKWFWRQSWKIAESYSVGGFSVSDRHTEFIRKKTGFTKSVNSIKAGSEPNKFLSAKGDPKKKLKLAYVGRLDRNREIRKLIQLSNNLKNNKVGHEINICGEGDQQLFIERECRGNASLVYHGKLKQREIMRVLAECHVGVMPMPDVDIWRISSPLKLAEYLASGLVIIGVDHPGNRIGPNVNPFHLILRDWEKQSVSKLQELVVSDWKKLTSLSLERSNSLSWQKISKNLQDDLWEFLRNSSTQS